MLGEGTVVRIGWTVMHEAGDSIRFVRDLTRRPCALSLGRAYAAAIGAECVR